MSGLLPKPKCSPHLLPPQPAHAHHAQVVATGEAAAKALSDYLVIHGSNPTADRDPHFSRLARAAIA
ncbi:hypothetical protein G6O67_006027 [Ophiocordyceps sinensis]|uniref:Uncharacterized protein n=1 Tax=Ophiocordyceps sinensis TaxID=72228 RepID=A0A8H4PPC9_9HYPO|nr:hypothetical protein G6O67_006027 [Ophiocordyceps sinensis]